MEKFKCDVLLHELLEDNETTFKELEEEFGAFISFIVLELKNCYIMSSYS